MNDENNIGQTEQIIRVCPLCGHDNRAKWPTTHGRGDWRIKQCDQCKFVYLENVVPYSELVENLAWSKCYRREQQVRQNREPVLMAISDSYKWIKRNILRRDKGAKLIGHLIPTGQMLDIGCGSGTILRKLPRTATPFGIEIEAEAAKIGHQYAAERGGRVWNRDALSGLTEIDSNHFNGVLMQSYLEHELYPREVLREVHRVLKIGGLAIIKVPNFACWNRRVRRNRWCGFRFPDHVNYFTPATLSQMATACGFSIHRFGLRDRIVLSDNMWMVVEKRSTRNHAVEAKAA